MSALTPAKLEQAAASVAALHPVGSPCAAMVAGSGITLSPRGWEKTAEVPFAEIFPFQVLPLLGHTPSLTIWRRDGRSVLVFNGRFHLYQGYSPAEVAAIPRLAGLLGAPAYIATNAAGTLDPAVAPGSLVIVRDHINLQGANPLIGEWGRWREPMFPDMSAAYDPALRALATRHAQTAGFAVHEGVYGGFLGPSYETPAEIQMLRRLGGTVVGMSTVQEVIAARHLGMRALVISLATNLAAGIGDRLLTHQEVIDAGAAARDRLRTLLELLLADLVGGAT